MSTQKGNTVTKVPFPQLSVTKVPLPQLSVTKVPFPQLSVTRSFGFLAFISIKRRRRSKLKQIVFYPIVVMNNKICLHKKEIQRKHDRSYSNRVVVCLCVDIFYCS
jgi:hypothetical protein